jgi:hypothetical protein
VSGPAWSRIKESAVSELDIFSFATKTTDAVLCLRDGGHHLQALMLTYVGIDQMAWLSIAEDESSAKDFKAWVDNYMLSKNPMKCTSDELWGARNGLLHMGTAEAKAHKNPNIRKIYYTFGPAQCVRNESLDGIFIRSEDLIEGFLTGVLWFMNGLAADPAQLATALLKMDKMLSLKVFPPEKIQS